MKHLGLGVDLFLRLLLCINGGSHRIVLPSFKDAFCFMVILGNEDRSLIWMGVDLGEVLSVNA